MKRPSISCLSVVALGYGASLVNAADELIIQVKGEKSELSALTAKVDGGQEKSINTIGVASLDLTREAHSGQTFRDIKAPNRYR